MELEEAREQLARGAWTEVVATVLGAKHGFAIPTTTDPDDADIAFDLQQVLALAIVRSGGKATPKLPGHAKSAAERAAFGLAWARLVLEYRIASGRCDPRDTMALAEALSTDPLMRPRARVMLRALADKDLMPSDRGTRLLAELDRESAS